jgi:uncharacterized membrane protein
MNDSSLDSAALPTSRIVSLDVMRGVVMVLMALDHVRVYSGIPAGGPTPGIFFTRWITHFCAPAFVFFAGTAAFLHGRKLGNKGALARYLVTRGIFLVILELTLIRFAWSFSLNYTNFALAGVIWMLGWCMILLAAFIWLPTWAIATLGLLIIVLQQVFGLVPRLMPELVRNSFGWLWEFVYPAGLQPPEFINILYVLVPWIGVMATGYGFGALMIRDRLERDKLCLRIGLIATTLFLLIGGLTVALSPAPENGPPALIRLLNQEKYPASQLFLLMTLGPTIAMLPLAERARGWFGNIQATFGRVPLFYYLLHIPVIHVTALLVWYLRDGTTHSESFVTAPYVWMPDHRWGLPLLYVVWLIVMVLLYLPCHWFAGVKARHKKGWLSYL